MVQLEGLRAKTYPDMSREGKGMMDDAAHTQMGRIRRTEFKWRFRFAEVTMSFLLNVVRTHLQHNHLIHF